MFEALRRKKGMFGLLGARVRFFFPRGIRLGH